MEVGGSREGRGGTETAVPGEGRGVCTKISAKGTPWEGGIPERELIEDEARIRS